ncbi:MAG: ribosome assembly RNA-binding protein YhbY [Gammaproteobacteria bacterium]
MVLTTKYKQQLKAKAHPLKPVVLMGAHGLTEAVKKEINGALEHHELIKVSVRTEDREQRKLWLAEICESLQAILIQRIGTIGVIYRKRA